jgi:hypothetical protein
MVEPWALRGTHDTMAIQRVKHVEAACAVASSTESTGDCIQKNRGRSASTPPTAHRCAPDQIKSTTEK